MRLYHDHVTCDVIVETCDHVTDHGHTTCDAVTQTNTAHARQTVCSVTYNIEKSRLIAILAIAKQCLEWKKVCEYPNLSSLPCLLHYPPSLHCRIQSIPNWRGATFPSLLFPSPIS